MKTPTTPVLPITRHHVCATAVNAHAASVLPATAVPAIPKKFTPAFFADIQDQPEEQSEMSWSSGIGEIVPVGGVPRISKVVDAIPLELGGTIQCSGHVVMGGGVTMIDPISARPAPEALPSRGRWLRKPATSSSNRPT